MFSYLWSISFKRFIRYMFVLAVIWVPASLPSHNLQVSVQAYYKTPFSPHNIWISRLCFKSCMTWSKFLRFVPFKNESSILVILTFCCFAPPLQQGCSLIYVNDSCYMPQYERSLSWEAGRTEKRQKNTLRLRGFLLLLQFCPNN